MLDFSKCNHCKFCYENCGEVINNKEKIILYRCKFCQNVILIKEKIQGKK